MDNINWGYDISEAVMFDTADEEIGQLYGHVIARRSDEKDCQFYDIATSSGAVHLNIPEYWMSIT